MVHVPAGASPEDAFAALRLGSADLDTLLTQLRMFARDAGMLARLCVRLSEVAPTLSDASAATAVAAVVTAMRAHTNHADLQHAGCAALCYLPLDSALKQRLRNGGVQPVAAAAADAGAIEAILHAMHTHASVLQVQRSASYALENLTCHSDLNAEKAVSLRAFGAVIAALRSWPSDMEMQAGGCAALCGVLGSSVNVSLQMKAVDAGALDVCIAVLKAHHPGVSKVWCAACKAVANMVTRNIPNIRKAVAAGVLPVLVAAMRSSCAAAADWAEVARCCCGTLNALVAPPSSTHMTAIRRQAVEADVLDALVTTLRGQRAAVEVQIHGCWTVASIFDDDEIAFSHPRALQAASRVIEVVVAALKAHTTNAELQHHGCNALWTLANRKADKQTAGRCGALAAVLTALRSHPEDQFVQCHGCGALHYLCEGVREHAAAARAAGAFTVVVAAMQKHADDLGILRNACEALAAMSAGISKSQQVQAAADGALQAIVVALKKAQPPFASQAHQHVQLNGCKAIRLFVDGCPSNARLAHDAGAVALIVDVVGAGLASRAPQQQPAGATSSTGGGPWQTMLDENHVTALEMLLRRHESADWALRAGALQTLHAGFSLQMSSDAAKAAFRDIAAHLQAAAARHDGAPCTHADCTLCAGARARGALCALPGCGACKRADDAAKKLLRCGSCRTVCYCSAAHQRDDWARHKGECRDLAAAAAAAKTGGGGGCGSSSGGGAS